MGDIIKEMEEAKIAVQEIPELLREILKTLQIIEIKLPGKGSVQWVKKLPPGKVVRSKRVK